MKSEVVKHAASPGYDRYMSSMRDPGGVHPRALAARPPPGGGDFLGWILLLLWFSLTAYGLKEFIRLLGGVEP